MNAISSVLRRRPVRWGIVLIVLVMLAIVGYRFWRHGQAYVSTDDAYVGANTVEVAAEVAGQVTHVYVTDNQHIEAGAALFDIDPRPYQIALEGAKAALEQRRAELANAQRIVERNRSLVTRGFMSHEANDTASTQLATARAGVDAAEAQLHQAQLDLQRTRVVAPAAGVIASLNLRPGASVLPRAPLFALISNAEYWVDANFKETQLHRLQVGQQASVKLDMYGDRTFRGVVESVAGGSGNAFSLLPPENATGNWVKVTQRVPVRVRILDRDAHHPLRVGTSAKVDVRVGR